MTPRCFAALLIFCSVCLAARPGNFQVIGPGGGGAQFNPTISPQDPNTVLVSCDMTGGYITHDGGKFWRMFNLRGTVKFFAFDPKYPQVIYAEATALWRSVDRGETWALVYPKPSQIKAIRMASDHADESIVVEPDALGSITAFAVDPGDSRTLYVSASKGSEAVLFVSHDWGNSWRREAGLDEPALHIWVNPNSKGIGEQIVLGGSHSISLQSADGVRSFPIPPSIAFTSLSAGFEDRTEAVLYGTSDQGTFVSRDGGSTWQKCTLPGGNGAQVRAIATSLRHPGVAYLSFNNLTIGRETWHGVAKTEDYGRDWTLVWKEAHYPAANVHDAWITERFGPGWGENPLMLGVSDQDPNLCYTTDLGRTMKTVDGGLTWNAVYSRKVQSRAWASTGLDVTTSYGIHFDPFDRRRQFITYTDIGLFRSEDGGKSWISSTAGVPERWVNTTYWVVFDPDIRGRMWSVNSGTHDLPRPKMWRHSSVLRYRGGVCRTDDGGKTWKASNSGMDETAATHILLDPQSSPNGRTFYVAAFGRGVYKSIDDGRTWKLTNHGIVQKQPFAWRLVRASDGTLYVLLSRKSENGDIGDKGDGAIYRSTDGAQNWAPVPMPEGVNAPNGFAIDPNDPQHLCLAAWARAVGSHGEGGGIYLSLDGGRNWHNVLGRDQHVYDVTIDPRDPNLLYAAGFESSAWRSTDRGEHWTRIPGFNFKWGHRVIPDPASKTGIYVTTYGGSVWHGSVNGPNRPVDISSPVLQPPYIEPVN
jgi:photosystem II stability/assembly factor-like uncharacterized protein